MRIISIAGAKGGVGTTTIACATAILLAQAGVGVRLMAGNGDHRDLLAVLGEANVDSFGHEREVMPGLIVGGQALGSEIVILDAGTDTSFACDEQWLIVRNCYLTLRRALNAPHADRVIAIIEPQRALSEADVAAVLGVTPTVLQWDPAVARTVDAGLLLTRLPKSLNAVHLTLTGAAQ